LLKLYNSKLQLSYFRGDCKLSEHWIQVSEKILAQLTKIQETDQKDRLELVSSLRFVMNILQRSFVGWMQWITNPEIMSMFSKTDLEQMTQELTQFTKSFVEYDIRMTGLGLQKGLNAPKKVKQKNTENRTEHFYV
jgi:hypothetical protein